MTKRTRAKAEKHVGHDVEHLPSVKVSVGDSSSDADMLALQRAAGNQAVNQVLQPTAENVPPVFNDVLKSSGQPLDLATREFMESRFDEDFREVRVHTDEQAADSARSINAQAYTLGKNIVFSQGRYSPSTLAGKNLLAHELTHVIQQEQRGKVSASIPTSNKPAELEARTAADSVARGGMGPQIVSAASGIQREINRDAPSAPPKNDRWTMDRYVDSYESAIYGLGYRVKGGESSSFIRLKYNDGISIDINIDDIGEETGRDVNTIDAMINQSYIGEGGRVFPSMLNFATTPRLWAAKHAVLKILDDYNTLWILATFPIWWSLMPVGPVSFGVKPTMRIRPMSPREVNEAVGSPSGSSGRSEVDPIPVAREPKTPSLPSKGARLRNESTSPGNLGARPRERAGSRGAGPRGDTGHKEPPPKSTEQAPPKAANEDVEVIGEQQQLKATGTSDARPGSAVDREPPAVKAAKRQGKVSEEAELRGAEHKKGARPSTREQHEEGQSTKQSQQRAADKRQKIAKQTGLQTAKNRVLERIRAAVKNLPDKSRSFYNDQQTSLESRLDALKKELRAQNSPVDIDQLMQENNLGIDEIVAFLQQHHLL